MAVALAVIVAAAQDKINAEAVHDPIVADLTTVNSIISKLTATIPANSTLNVSPFYITLGQIFQT